jgi:hypothetical protein
MVQDSILQMFAKSNSSVQLPRRSLTMISRATGRASDVPVVPRSASESRALHGRSSNCENRTLEGAATDDWSSSSAAGRSSWRCGEFNANDRGSNACAFDDLSNTPNTTIKTTEASKTAAPQNAFPARSLRNPEVHRPETITDDAVPMRKIMKLAKLVFKTYCETYHGTQWRTVTAYGLSNGSSGRWMVRMAQLSWHGLHGAIQHSNE